MRSFVKPPCEVGRPKLGCPMGTLKQPLQRVQHTLFNIVSFLL